MQSPQLLRSPLVRRLAAPIFTTLICAAGSLASAVEYWVSPTGSDTNSGTSSTTSWKTITKARDYIRTNNLNDNLAADLIVNLVTGEYPITSTAAFGLDDSGSNGHSVVYRAVDGPGTARLVGCTDLGGWTNITGTNLWKVFVGTGKTVDSIFEDGVRGRSARHPNYVLDARYPESCAPYVASTAGGHITTPSSQDWIQYNAGEFTWPGAIPTSAKVMWWKYAGSPDWGIAPEVALYSVDSANRKIYMEPFAASAPSSAERYFVQGLYEFLDSPGEFFYSSGDGWLYYYPRTTNPNAAGIDIRVPLLPRLISVTGSAPATHAHHIKFEGLSFSYTNATTSNFGVIHLESTDHIEILNCQFAQVGHTAIRMWNANADNLIYGCLFQHTAHAGIVIHNTLLRATYPNDRSERNIVSNCKFESIGERYTSAVETAGVVLWSTRDCEVSYCEISGSPRYAISLRGHWSTQRGVGLEDDGTHFATDNIFKYIRATDCMSDSGDGAIVHAAHCNGSGDPTGADKINDWQQILISGAYAHASMQDIAPNGIFLDHPNSCLYQRFTDIKISDTQGAAFRTNVNPTQTLSNVSWSGTFNEGRMEYSRIGLKSDFPKNYDSRDTVIADDHTGDYTETGLTAADSTIGGLYRGDGRFINPGTSSQYVEWRPTLPRTGNYQVSAWKMGNNSAATTAAPYTINYQGGSTVVPVDQTAGLPGWTNLGTYPFTAGRSAAVRLSSNASDSKPMRADAVKLTFTGYASLAIGGEKGWWAFDNNGNDASGLGHTAAGVGVGYSSSIKAEGTHSLYLNGAAYSEVADTDDLDLGTGDLAIAGWFYRDSLLPNGQPNTAGNLRVLSKGAGSDLKKGYAVWTGSTSITVAIGNGTVRRSVSASHLGPDVWNHFIVNISRSGYLTLYVNGTKVAALNISDWRDLDLSNTDKLNIGRNVNSGAENWVGRIDDIAVYQRVLGETEIAALFN